MLHWNTRTRPIIILAVAIVVAMVDLSVHAFVPTTTSKVETSIGGSFLSKPTSGRKPVAFSNSGVDEQQVNGLPLQQRVATTSTTASFSSSALFLVPAQVRGVEKHVHTALYSNENTNRGTTEASLADELATHGNIDSDHNEDATVAALASSTNDIAIVNTDDGDDDDDDDDHNSVQGTKARDAIDSTKSTSKKKRRHRKKKKRGKNKTEGKGKRMASSYEGDWPDIHWCVC